MRFLVLGLDVDIGHLSGDSVHLKELAENLTAIGHEVSVIVGASGETEAPSSGFYYYLKGKRLWSVIREVHLIARGNTLVQVLNGHVMSMLIDDDAANRALDGLIGIQVHRGPAMKVEVRNIRLKRL